MLHNGARVFMKLQGLHGQFLAGKAATVGVTSSAAATTAFYSAKSRQGLGLGDLSSFGGSDLHINFHIPDVPQDIFLPSKNCKVASSSTFWLVASSLNRTSGFWSDFALNKSIFITVVWCTDLRLYSNCPLHVTKKNNFAFTIPCKNFKPRRSIFVNFLCLFPPKQA